MQKMIKNPTTVRRDPFQSLFARVFQDMVSDFHDGRSSKAPPANISETDAAYELAFELPGLEEKDIHVHVEDSTLTITAERKDSRADDDAEGNRKWHRIEHRHGSFARTISLPRDAASEGIDAVYERGVLTVSVPKAPEAQKKRIEVRGN